MVLQARAQPRLLVAEDDSALLALVQAVLEEGYAITPARSLPTAPALLDEHLSQRVPTDLFAPQVPDLHQYADQWISFGMDGAGDELAPVVAMQEANAGIRMSGVLGCHLKARLI